MNESDPALTAPPVIAALTPTVVVTAWVVVKLVVSVVATVDASVPD